MLETCQKLAFTYSIVVSKSGLKNNWMKKLNRVNRPLECSLLIYVIPLGPVDHDPSFCHNVILSELC